MNHEIVEPAAEGFTLRRQTCCPVTPTSRARKITSRRPRTSGIRGAVLLRMGRWHTGDNQTMRERRKWVVRVRISSTIQKWPTSRTNCQHPSRRIILQARQQWTTGRSQPEDRYSLETFQVATKWPWIRMDPDPQTAEYLAFASEPVIRRQTTREIGTVRQSTDLPACSRTLQSSKPTLRLYFGTRVPTLQHHLWAILTKDVIGNLFWACSLVAYNRFYKLRFLHLLIIMVYCI